MAALATQDVTLTGLGATYAAAAGGGDTFVPGEDVFLHVKNGGASPITVTVTTPNTAVGGLAIADSVTTVPNAGERFIGPFPAQHFVNASGVADVAYSGVTSVTVAVVRV